MYDDGTQNSWERKWPGKNFWKFKDNYPYSLFKNFTLNVERFGVLFLGENFMNVEILLFPRTNKRCKKCWYQQSEHLYSEWFLNSWNIYKVSTNLLLGMCCVYAGVSSSVRNRDRILPILSYSSSPLEIGIWCFLSYPSSSLEIAIIIEL